jgi:ABC-2 type transport system permease protein
MIRILDIAGKDLRQLIREKETFLFLLLMPIIFTLLFGYAFGGFGGGENDPRLPVGYLDEDGSAISARLRDLLAGSEVIQLEEDPEWTAQALERRVAAEDLAAAIFVPAGFGEAAAAGSPLPLSLVADPATSAGSAVRSEADAAAQRLMNAVRTAAIVVRVAGAEAEFDAALGNALAAWADPPIAIQESVSTAIEGQDNRQLSLAHTAPAMMVQFAMAAPMTAGQIIVNERKCRAFHRLLTTATPRFYILLGHFLAMLALILMQFTLLIAFAQLALGVDYLRAPGASLILALVTAVCVASMGLLIGILARSEDQAVIFSLVPMFVLSGLGGAWVPLEFTGPTFQAIGHVSPIAWALDGFKNVLSRGLGVASVLTPSAALLGYAAFFFILAVWRFRSLQER